MTVGLVAAAVMFVLLAAAQAIDFGLFDLRIRELNADHRLSIFAIASLLAQMAAAVASAVRGRRTERHRRLWLTIAGLIATLLLVRGLTSFSATVLALPLACVFALVCGLTWHDNLACRAVVWGALVLLATSLLLHKVGVDADSSTVSDYSWDYQIVGIVKHGAELAGWILMSTGIVAGAATTTSKQAPGRRHDRGAL